MAVETYSGYREYQERTDREIPLVILEPRSLRTPGESAPGGTRTHDLNGKNRARYQLSYGGAPRLRQAPWLRSEDASQARRIRGQAVLFEDS